jgi:hypothetical protein
VERTEGAIGRNVLVEHLVSKALAELVCDRDGAP